MGFDPVTYVLSANAAGGGASQAAERQYENLQAEIRMLSSVFEGRPRYKDVYGNGVISVRDAASGPIDYIQVDSGLAGQTLYVQVSNASGMTEAQAEADDNGYVTVDLSTVSGENFIYLTTQDYAFPPTGDGEHGELDGVYINARTNENGLAVYDSIQLTDGVHALVRYRVDYELYSEIANEKSEERTLAASGKGVRYVAIQTPPSVEDAEGFFYMKMDGYPYGTQAKPTYVQTGYPNPDCQVYYVRQIYDLTE